MHDDRESSGTAAGPKVKPFRKKFAATRLAPAAVERQSRITLLAWNALGADAAIVYLNNYSAALDGRPLDLAVSSTAGYDAVEREIIARMSSG